jgi:hypothetical protein
MNTSESLQALRRANPRTKPGFAPSLEASTDAVRALIAAGAEPRVRRVRRLPSARASAAGASLAAALGVVAFFALASPRGGPTVQDAVAAVNQAATLTAASAERSGTAVVRLTHNGELWAGSTIRWNGEDLALRSDSPDRQGRVGSETLVVDGMMYALDTEDGRWAELGPPESIDPDSGTTPGETLAAVQEDVGGATLERITGGMMELTTSRVQDGSTVYSGRVAAGLIARETGFKEGESIRVLPFGNVAHDEAEDPSALLDTAITVGPDGIVRQIDVAWGTWRYTVAFSDLGETSAPKAPANARPLRRR